MPIMSIHPAPVPHPKLIIHIETYLDRKGSAWARALMAKVAPWEQWPEVLRTAVVVKEAREREEATHEPADLFD